MAEAEKPEESRRIKLKKCVLWMCVCASITHNTKTTMIRFILLALMTCLAEAVSGQTVDTCYSTGGRTVRYVEAGGKRVLQCVPVDLMPENGQVDKAKVERLKSLQTIQDAETTEEEGDLPSETFNVVTTDYGQVEGILTGDEQANQAATIAVTGPMDESDFKAIWRCAADGGNLRTLDLGKALIKDHIVPDRALYDYSQFDDWYWLKIRKIILPDDVEQIGIAAFAMMELEEINIPSSLREVGLSAFVMDRRLDCPLVFPEGMEIIDHQAFNYCWNLSHSPVFPSTLKKIGDFAFAGTNFKELELKEGLEYIGVAAFQGTGMIEVTLPNCNVTYRENAFEGCKVEKVTFPDTMEEIPLGLFCYCYSLKQVTLPKNCKVIGKDAFRMCMELKEITFPETLEVIENSAFAGCEIAEIVLPSSLKRLGPASLNVDGLLSVYSQSVVPPVCEKDSQGGWRPFGEYNHSGTTLYVPVGTKELYRSQWGWDIFPNIVETDAFPSTSVSSVRLDNPDADDSLYDLSGRRTAQPAQGQVYIQNGKKHVK